MPVGDFQNFTLSFWLHNRGPSPIRNASLRILLPLTASRVPQQYYLYPYSITVSMDAFRYFPTTSYTPLCIQIDPSDTINCSKEGVIDPENVQSTGFITNRLFGQNRSSLIDVVSIALHVCIYRCSFKVSLKLELF